MQTTFHSKDLINFLPLPELNCSPAECPAPPGTRVNLHGVILHETLGGMHRYFINPIKSFCATNYFCIL